MVTTLRDDLAQCKYHIKELESVLPCSEEDDLAVKVNQLTKPIMKLERSLQAKQKLVDKQQKLNQQGVYLDVGQATEVK